MTFAAAAADVDPTVPRTVLVVEDEALIRLMLVEALEDQAYRVLEADNAAAAIAVLEQNESVDLVVSDVRMPGEMDGVALARWIRANRPGTKIVLASGYVSGVDQRELGGTIDGFVGKPYRAGEMVERVSQLLAAPA